VTRRSLLQWILAALGIDAIGLSGCAARPGAGGTFAPVKTKPLPTSESGTLSRTEVEDLVAFGEVLVEGRTLAASERQDLVQHLQDRVTRSPEYLSLYRTTVSALEHLAGRRFASVGIHKRLEITSRYRIASTQVRPGGDPGEFSAELRTLRTRVVPDLITAYYGSPAGWATVGYLSFPGRCGDLSRYTRPEP
jgi:hypothetical protein